jgi:hypothetical protein
MTELALILGVKRLAAISLPSLPGYILCVGDPFLLGDEPGVFGPGNIAVIS